MTESVLASLAQPTTEADNASPEPAATEVTGAEHAGTPAAPAGDGSRNDEVSAGAPGNGDRSDNRNPDGAEKPDKTGDKLVPLAALHESREKIRALTSQIEELRKQPQLSEEDRQLLADLKAQREAAKQPKDPDFLEDPKGYIDAQAKKTQAALKELKEGEAKRNEAEQQQQQAQQVIAATLAKESEFSKTTADYPDALNHLRNVRGQQLRMLFPQATDEQIRAQIGREELSAAAQILQAGGNPAEFAYKYAQTYGYAPKAKPAVNGIAAAAAAAVGAAPDKDAVRTLGGGGGAEPTGDENADPIPEFSAALKERFTRKRK